jgi:plasmid stabilization system protein ParE
MSLPLAFLPEALDDIDAAYAIYEQRSAGSGDQFLKTLRLLLEGIADNPGLYATISRQVRAAPLRRFPQVVYYRDETSRILIIAVQHGRRSSRAWRGRT